MATSLDRKELVAIGYVRRLKFTKMTPPIIVKSISMWISLVDVWDRNDSDKSLEIGNKYWQTFEDGNVKLKNYGYVKRVQMDAEVHKRWQHAFGTDIVKKRQIKTWTLKLNKLTSTNDDMISLIGIIDADDVDANISDFTSKEVFGYGLATTNQCVYHCDDLRYFRHIPPGSFRFARDITMELDLINGKLSYSVDGITNANNVYSNIAFEKVDTNRSYRLVIALYENDEILIID